MLEAVIRAGTPWGDDPPKPPRGKGGGVALIGGGATGIGFAVAARLAPTHQVVITGRHAEPLEKAAAALAEQTGATVGTLVSDVSGPDSAAVLDALAVRYGPPDVLVLNAGGPPPGRILDVADDAWQAGAELAPARPAAGRPTGPARDGRARLRPAGFHHEHRGPPAPA